MASTFIIDNVTLKDIEKKTIRITKGGQHLFPEEILGQPETYRITLIFEGREYSGTHKTGSRDGKSRSGLLKSPLFNEMGSRLARTLELKRISPSNYSLQLR